MVEKKLLMLGYMNQNCISETTCWRNVNGGDIITFNNVLSALMDGKSLVVTPHSGKSCCVHIQISKSC